MEFLDLDKQEFFQKEDKIQEYNQELVDDKLDKMIDDYIMRYDQINNLKTCYDLYFGEFIFIKFDKKKYKHSKIIRIFSVFVIPEYRRNGILKRFIKKVIDKTNKNVTIEDVISKDVISFMDKFRYKESKFKLINHVYIYNKL